MASVIACIKKTFSNGFALKCGDFNSIKNTQALKHQDATFDNAFVQYKNHFYNVPIISFEYYNFI